LLLGTLIHLGFKQASAQFHTSEYVQCYFDNENGINLILFDSINGSPVDTLPRLSHDMCWYVLTLSENDRNWFKVEQISALPLCREHPRDGSEDNYKGLWVQSGNLFVDTPDMDLPADMGIKFYKEPDLNSKVVFKSGKFKKTRLIAVSGNWAKVQFRSAGKKRTGWLQKDDQCASPWTSCPKITE
jgi:hypothetical protein